MNVLAELRQRFATSLASFIDDEAQLATLVDMIRPAQDSQFGDYQANCAMPLGKRIGKPPREIAQQIVERLDVADLCQPPEIAGPGFINLRLHETWLSSQLTLAVGDERLGIAATETPRTIVLDYSSPNVAKPMHVGHIRSTVIGDALYRVLSFLGHDVISDNHLGDWGTQFGMILFGYKKFLNAAAYADRPIDELSRLYRLVRRLIEYHGAIADLPVLQEKLINEKTEIESHAARDFGDDKKAAKKGKAILHRLKGQHAKTREKIEQAEQKIEQVESDAALKSLADQHVGIADAVLGETARLHAGDPENLALWKEVLPACIEDIHHIYRRLGVTFDNEHGESFYHDQLADVVADFQQRGLASESEGAICVFLDGFDAPMIIRKRDGAYLYATTDLATLRHRIGAWQADAILYVVDFRQGDHFDKLFAAARRWGYDQVELAHVSFGTVLGDNGRPFQTRSGDTVSLEGLLDEAEHRAYEVVSNKDEEKGNGAELSEEDRKAIAPIVGIAALKYADLSQNRTSDYVFSYDKMLALEGNTATYMQYAYARVRSIFRRGKIDPEPLRVSPAALQLDAPSERALAIELLRFEEALGATVADYRPNHLTSYLFELADSFSTFYQQCPVLKAENEALLTSRLLLCDLTARTIQKGLSLLGIDVVERM